MNREERIGMTPKAKAFCEANDASPVVSGYVNEPDPTKPAKGGTYKLEDGKRFRLNLADCQCLPTGYPRWKL